MRLQSPPSVSWKASTLLNKRFKLFTTLTLSMLVLAACASGPASPAAPSNEPMAVKIVLPPYLSNSPIFIAQEEGYFADAGLEVEVVILDRSVDALPALIQKQVDVTSDAINAATLSAIAQGENVRLVADKGYLSPGCSYDSLLASAGAAAAGGLDNSDLLAGGTKLAVTQANYREFWVSKLFAQKGLSVDNFEWVVVPPAALGETLQAGDIAFATVAEPSLTQVLNAQQGVVIANANEVVPGFQYSFVNFGPSILEDNPEAGRRFMVAYLRGVRQFIEGKTDRNVQIIAEGTGLDPELVRATCWPTFDENISIHTEDILTFQEWAVSAGYLDAALPVDSLIDTSFQQYAVEQLAP